MVWTTLRLHAFQSGIQSHTNHLWPSRSFLDALASIRITCSKRRTIVYDARIGPAPQVQQRPAPGKMQHARCTIALGRERGVQRPSTLWAHTRTTQAYAKGCEAYTAYPRPSTGPRKDRAPLFYQSPHRSPHTSQVQLRCNGNGTTPRELPPPGNPPPRHAACGGNTVATVHSDLH